MEWLIIIGIVIYIFSKLGSNTDRTTTSSSNSDLSDFDIKIGTSSNRFGHQLSKNRKPGKWIQPGQSVKIAKYEIIGGHFYRGGQLKSSNSYDTEASLIDPTLKVNSKSPDYNGEQMGYWPYYCDITPQSRAAYLEWLASNRDDPTCYIGYVFLYFYGIERRLLIDGKNIPSSERRALINEIWRLKRIYGSNRSFNRYATGLLAHVWLLYNRDEQPDKSLLIDTRNFTSVFKFLLGKAADNRAPVSSELALAWVRSHPEYSLRTPARRCKREFDLLFIYRYQEKYGQGITIKPNKKKLRLGYESASYSLRGYQDIALDLPDPSLLKAPVRKLMQLAETCMTELDAYSRYIGNPANSKESISAIAYLPDVLTELVEHTEFSNLKSWLRSKMTNSVGIIQTGDLSSQVWGNTPIKINKKEAQTLVNIVEKVGFGLAPDIRFHHAKPDISGCIVLFESGHGPDFNPSYEFNHVGTIVRLGSMVATIDGRVDDTEVSVLDKLIADDSCLSETEKKSLHGYLHWRLNTSPDMSGLKNRLQHFNEREKAAISHILVGVALADGKIEPTEIKQLRKLYTSLGLDEAMVSSDIHNLTSRKIKPSPAGYQAQTKVDDETTSAISLNPDLLNLYKGETEDVKDVLDGIFDEEINEDETPVPVDNVVTTPQVTGLDGAHTHLVERLICKEKWSSEEVKDICKELNLMVDGAIEVINDWAFDNVEAPLLDDGSMLYVDLEVAQEIRDL